MTNTTAHSLDTGEVLLGLTHGGAPRAAGSQDRCLTR